MQALNTAKTQCDPITVEIVAGALKSTISEMESTVERTAMSPFIREKKDFNAGVFGADGELIACSGRMAMTMLIHPVLEVFPKDDMRPGDVYWYNDCYGSKGAVSHSPDLVFVRPVFVDGEILAFSQSWAHFNDIGGLHPGTLSSEATEIFHEGIIVPPVRLVREDEVNEDLLRMFSRNSRFPDMVRGDVRALLAAVRLGERRMVELFGRVGTLPMLDAVRQLAGRTEAEVLARARRTFAPGKYSFTEVIDSDGQGNGPFDIVYDVTVSDNRITLDTSRSSDQTPGPFNYLLTPEVPAATLASFLIGEDPRFASNAGSVKILDEVILREGSILQPRFPAPLGMRGVTAIRTHAVWFGLLAQATGGQINASNPSYVVCYVRGQTDDGKPFLITDPIGTGYGGRPYADGNDGIYLSANENYPAEFVENTFPLRIRRYALAMDSGGPGRWRGGCGVVRDIEMLAPEGTMAIRLDSTESPPWGVAGGKSGGRGRCLLNPGKPNETAVDPISDSTIVRRGDVIRIITGGGGGWGHPYDREPERVLTDVLGGFVSVGAAESEYGVAITDDMSVDQARTDELRSRRPEAKLFHRDEYRDTL